jgi:4-hydroxybenzoyl-CoA thioesterase
MKKPPNRQNSVEFQYLTSNRALKHERIPSMAPEQAAPVVATGTAEPAPMAARDGRMNRNVRIVRIQWGDCDPAGIVFNPRYFEIFDASTAALFEAALGITKREMLEKYNSAGIALVRTAATFHKPVRFGDDVSVESVISFSRSSFNVEHRVRLRDHLCAEGAETRVWIVREATGALKSSPIPPDVMEKFRMPSPIN